MAGTEVRAEPESRSGPLPLPELGRNFRLYAAGQAVSILGDRVALIALVFLIIHLSPDAAQALAIFYAVRAVPALVSGLFVGPLADLVDRRRLMLACDLGRAVLLAAVPALTGLNLASLYPLVFVLYALTLVFNTASSAALPDVVPPLRLMSANAILNGLQNAGDLAYAAGGALILLLGYRVPFYLDAATFLFSAVTIFLMRLPSPAAEERERGESFLRRVRRGLAFIAGNPFLRWSTVTFAIAPLAGGAGYVLAPLYARSVLTTGPWLAGPLRNGAFRFSVLEIALGLGALAGTTLTPRLPKRLPRGALFGLGLLGTGLFDALLATTRSIYVAVPLMALSGAFFSLWMISGLTLSQSLTPTEVRGRVVAARVALINGALLAGSALAGVALQLVSIRALWAAEGSLIMLSSLAIWLRPAVRGQP